MDALIRKALVHPKRTAILGYLMQKRGEEGTDGSELADFLGLTTAKVKYHLRVLRDADLISHIDDRGAGTVERYIAVVSAGK